LQGDSRFYLSPTGFHFASHCNANERTRNAANRCVLQAYNAAKWTAAMLGGGSIQRSSDPLAGFKGASVRGKGQGRTGAGREGMERGG